MYSIHHNQLAGCQLTQLLLCQAEAPGNPKCLMLSRPSSLLALSCGGLVKYFHRTFTLSPSPPAPLAPTGTTAQQGQQAYYYVGNSLQYVVQLT